MNAYVKSICMAVGAIAASAVVSARPAEPGAVVLPSPIVASIMQYLNARPYQEVSGLMGNLQRCLQDQVPDEKGNIAERGGCPEITIPLRQMRTPLAKAPPKVQ